jgi:hypothetical protein
MLRITKKLTLGWAGEAGSTHSNCLLVTKTGPFTMTANLHDLGPIVCANRFKRSLHWSEQVSIPGLGRANFHAQKTQNS